MLRRAAELAAAGGARCLVSLEANMACGFGICLGCAVPTLDRFRYVCTHGPVFEAETLDWGGLP
jgi:dihydroorotate dehydrogenase electron transfer subunit